MPKSDTWPGGGLETMNGMDSAGSCDSIVSANSGYSDDSLEHLSAEERACLMFLEETIESLDTEEDSGLSNDEPDQLPSPGNVAAKVAALSAAMSKSKLSSPQTHDSNEPVNKNVDAKSMQNYLVSNHLVVASSVPCSVQSTKPGIAAVSKPGYKQNQKPVANPAPSEADVLPPSTKPSVRTTEGPLPRGPLSYDALVHLRRSASTKKTPLCPTVDHTIDTDNHLPASVEGPTLGNLPRSERFQSEVSKSKKGPPVVPPKPKMIPAAASAKTQDEASIFSDTSYSVKNAPDLQVVRLKALQKLGLLKDNEPQNDEVAPPPPPKSHSSLDPAANRFTRGPSNCNASRSPSFCTSQVSTEPKNRPLKTSASFIHHSKHDQQPVSNAAKSNGLKTADLERSATLDNHRNNGNCNEPQNITSAKPEVPQKPSNLVGYTVMVVPGMGAERKQALRKLGLLKD